MNQPIQHPRLWKALVGSLGGALVFSLWAALGTGDCTSCRGVHELWGGSPLGWAGVAFYALLLGGALLGGPSHLLFGSVILAAGVHGGLLAVLVHERIFCAPCVGAAGSVLAALGCAIRIRGSLIVPAGLGVPAVASLLQAWAVLGGIPALSAPPPEEGATARGIPPPFAGPGTVRMLIYSRPDCGYCLELDRSVLPELVLEFGPGLQIERRSAEGLPGIPTPTLILSGAGRTRLFPGLPEPGELRRALLELKEECAHDPTLPEKSR